MIAGAVFVLLSAVVANGHFNKGWKVSLPKQQSIPFRTTTTTASTGTLPQPRLILFANSCNQAVQVFTSNPSVPDGIAVSQCYLPNEGDVCAIPVPECSGSHQFFGGKPDALPKEALASAQIAEFSFGGAECGGTDIYALSQVTTYVPDYFPSPPPQCCGGPGQCTSRRDLDSGNTDNCCYEACSPDPTIRFNAGITLSPSLPQTTVPFEGYCRTLRCFEKLGNQGDFYQWNPDRRYPAEQNDEGQYYCQAKFFPRQTNLERECGGDVFESRAVRYNTFPDWEVVFTGCDF